jgi:two-component system cell cycle sensor histidine kinase/response regulator CckA
VTRPITVLLVEDNPGDARLIVEMLKDVHADTFDVIHADRIESALERLSHAAVDVVLLDLGLPDGQGLETFERVRRGAGSEPIIVISGLDDEQVALEAVRAGAQDYLVKGRIEGQLLARVIRYAIERKRGEAKLRWLTLAVEQSPVSVFITDPKGTIEYINSTFTQVTGYTPAEAIGQTSRILKSGLTPPAVYRALWHAILAGETWRGEIQNRRKSGELYWDSVVISPIRDAHGGIVRFLGVQEDITERKQAEQAIRERDLRFQQLAENIKEVFFVMGAQHREIIYISPAYEKAWGRSCQSLYDNPQSFLDPVPPDDRARVLATIARNQSGEDVSEVEFRVRRPDGEVRWMLAHAVPVRNERGEVYRIAGVSLDITERRRAQEALLANEQRLRTLFETVNLIVLGLDGAGKVDYVNPYLLRLTGYTRDEAFGSNWVERFLPKAQRAEVTTTLRDLLERGAHTHHQNPILTKAGEERMISWHNIVLRDLQGRPSGTLSIGEDITEHARLEAQYRQAQKMEAVGRLAGGVAHDFNNLLTAIFGYTDLLAEDLPPDHPGRADLDEIRTAATRAAALTRQLLAFSRQQVLQPLVLNLNDVVEGVEKMLHRLLGEDVELQTSLAGDLGNVRADAGQIEQVIMNLAVNARDAMPTGGKLTIETANVDLGEAYTATHPPVLPGPFVMLAVSDTGIGMDDTTKARVFEPFFTTKEPGKGTGLGLATVYGIVKQSGGHIWLYAEPGKGTAFKIYLPRVDAPLDAPVVASGPRGTVAGTETVLVAEDDELLRPLERELLTKLGYRVLDARDAAGALAVARGHEGEIHLLVSDVVMPGGGGFQLAQLLLAERPGLRVLYISGYTDEAVVRHGLLDRGLNFLQKPFTPAVLARKVREVLDAK